MRVVLDTNVVLQMFGARSPFAPLKAAVVSGQVSVAISTGIWLEYEEVLVRYAGAALWGRVTRVFELAGSIGTMSSMSSRRLVSASSWPMRMTTSLPIVPSPAERIS